MAAAAKVPSGSGQPHCVGGEVEYGASDVARFAGTLTSPVISNPQLGPCGSSGRHA